MPESEAPEGIEIEGHQVEIPSTVEGILHPKDASKVDSLLIDLRGRPTVDDNIPLALHDLTTYYQKQIEDNGEESDHFKPLMESVLSLESGDTIETRDAIIEDLKKEKEKWEDSIEGLEGERKGEAQKNVRIFEGFLNLIREPEQPTEEATLPDTPRPAERITFHPPENIPPFELQPGTQRNEALQTIANKRRSSLEDLDGFCDTIQTEFSEQENPYREAHTTFDVGREVVQTAGEFYNENRAEAISDAIIYVVRDSEGVVTAGWERPEDPAGEYYTMTANLNPTDPTSVGHFKKIYDSPIQIEKNIAQVKRIVSHLKEDGELGGNLVILDRNGKERPSSSDEEIQLLQNFIQEYAGDNGDAIKNLYALIGRIVDPSAVDRFVTKIGFGKKQKRFQSNGKDL